MRIVLTAFCVSVAASAGCGFLPGEESYDGAPADISHWERHTSVGGNFFCKLPEKANYFASKTIEVGDMKLTVQLEGYESLNGDEAYFVAYCNYPYQTRMIDPKFGDKVLKRVVKGFAAGSGLSVKDQEPMRLQGRYAGIKYTAKGRTRGHRVYARGRSYLVGRRLFQTIGLWYSGKNKAAQAEAFLESFGLAG